MSNYVLEFSLDGVQYDLWLTLKQNNIDIKTGDVLIGWTAKHVSSEHGEVWLWEDFVTEKAENNGDLLYDCISAALVESLETVQ